MDRLNITNKVNGDTLEASEFNSLVSKVNELVESENNGGSSTIIDPTGVISTSSKGNVTIGSAKNINVEPAWDNNAQNYSGNYGDIAFKPGDDIQFCSHHREPKKRDKIVIKSIDGSDNPVKMQIVAGEIDFAAGTPSNPKTATRKKDKTTGADTSDPLFKADDAKVLDVRILTGVTLDSGQTSEREERGYLKVRAQAIDLRCEKHGGIALQPKGYDNDGNMNKIKFEHGGGDGLEFGTFNTEKSSLYTNEYRFKKDGIWKMATRQTTSNSKAVYDDNTPVGKQSTAALKYVKQADDFYDVISSEDVQTTTEDIITTANALNSAPGIATKITGSGNCKISAASYYQIALAEDQTEPSSEIIFPLVVDKNYEKDDLKTILYGGVTADTFIGTTNKFKISSNSQYYVLINAGSPKISISSEKEVDIESKTGDVVINFGDTLKCEGPEIRLNAMNPDKSGGTVNFGSTAEVLFLEKKFTKSGNVEAPTTPTEVKLATYNNSWKTIYWDSSISKFRRQADLLYTDSAHTTLYDPTNHVQETPIYFSDGTLVPADTTCFVRYNDNGVIKIYKVGTKGSSAVLSKSNDLIAIISGGNYERQFKKDGVTYYCPDLIIEEDNWTPGAGLTEVQPEGFVLSTSCLVEDIVKLAAWAKTNNFGPWAV